MIKPLNIRPEPELREKIEIEAEKEERSLNKMCLILLREAVKHRSGGE